MWTLLCNWRNHGRLIFSLKWGVFALLITFVAFTFIVLMSSSVAIRVSNLSDHTPPHAILSFLSLSRSISLSSPTFWKYMCQLINLKLYKVIIVSKFYYLRLGIISPLPSLYESLWFLPYLDLRTDRYVLKTPSALALFLLHLVFALCIFILLFNLQYFKSFSFHPTETERQIIKNSFFLSSSSLAVLHPEFWRQATLNYFFWFCLLFLKPVS